MHRGSTLPHHIEPRFPPFPLTLHPLPNRLFRARNSALWQYSLIGLVVALMCLAFAEAKVGASKDEALVFQVLVAEICILVLLALDLVV